MKVQVDLLSFIHHFESVGQSKWLIPQDVIFVSCQLMFSNINEKGIYSNAYYLVHCSSPMKCSKSKTTAKTATIGTTPPLNNRLQTSGTEAST